MDDRCSLLILQIVFRRPSVTGDSMKEVLENVARHALAVLLVFIFLVSVFVSLTNPESYFFGEKLSGEKAIIHLLAGGITGMAIAYLLFKKKSGGEILSAFYFAYFSIETLIANLSLGFGLLPSPLFTTGLAISTVLLVFRKVK